MLLAAVHAASELCLLPAYNRGLLLLAKRMRGRLDAACCSLWFQTKRKNLRKVTKTCDMFANRGICHKS